ncbi:hypothetical protein [Occallatibacter savannae]|uniref:hypothetical protein n=1 Tax=Occallatibacter savannae TaxID=1002691 RepID=UPI000D687E98|nr:hypothetical protein [Occallatibacter savannae]
MGYYTRVLSKHEDFPSLEELSQLLAAEHPSVELTVEEGDEDDWETLLLSGHGELEIALLERNPVSDGSIGQDEIAEFTEETADSKPESGVAWLHEFLAETKTIYAFQHLVGSETEEGLAALHAVRSFLWQRGDSIIQADMEGFTNEDGYHIVWQFSDTVSGAWNMAVLQDDTWHHFQMDLGDPDQREAFFRGEVPPDASQVQLSRGRE